MTSPTQVLLPVGIQEIVVAEDWPLQYREIQELQAADFLVGDTLVLPDHGWDLREANIYFEVRNLRMVRSADVFGGPTVLFYEKEDPNAPAFAATIYDEGSALLAWMQW